jgi:hypothetical protein
MPTEADSLSARFLTLLPKLMVSFVFRDISFVVFHRLLSLSHPILDPKSPELSAGFSLRVFQ